MHEYDEYKRLWVLQSALNNVDGVRIPMNIIKEQIHPLREWLEQEIIRIEKDRN